MPSPDSEPRPGPSQVDQDIAAWEQSGQPVADYLGNLFAAFPGGAYRAVAASTNLLDRNIRFNDESGQEVTLRQTYGDLFNDIDTVISEMSEAETTEFKQLNQACQALPNEPNRARLYEFALKGAIYTKLKQKGYPHIALTV